jgi:hypothetical protein
MNAELSKIDRVSFASSAHSPAADPGKGEDVLKLVQNPSAWKRWLDWLPKVRMLPPSDSPFASPANVTLQQRVFLNGKAIEIPLK